jgi:hypothetical protein
MEPIKVTVADPGIRIYGLIFKLTYIENLETSNIQYTNELLTLLLSVERDVDLFDEPLEESIEQTLAHGTTGVGDLVLVTTLGHKLVTDLDPRLQQVLVQIQAINSQKLSNPLSFLLLIRIRYQCQNPKRDE